MKMALRRRVSVKLVAQREEVIPYISPTSPLYLPHISPSPTPNLRQSPLTVKSTGFDVHQALTLTLTLILTLTLTLAG